MPDNSENGQKFVKIVLKSIISVSERYSLETGMLENILRYLTYLK